jgi:hypothetical protein
MEQLALGISELAERVRSARAQLGNVRLICIDGPSRSGKSTVASSLQKELLQPEQSGVRALRTELVSTDEFATWSCPFDWWGRLESGVLRPLSAHAPAHFIGLVWLWGFPQPAYLRTFAPPDVLLLEGVSSARSELGRRASLRVWVEGANVDERKRRFLDEYGSNDLDLFLRWQEQESRHFAVSNTKQRADVRLVLPTEPPTSARSLAPHGGATAGTPS